MINIFNNWVICGFGAAFSFSSMFLLYKKILLENVTPLILNFLVFVFTGTWFGLWIKFSKTNFEVSKNVIFLIFLASICALAGNFLDVKAVMNAPNPGYASTLKASQIIIITLIAPILFEAHFSISKIIGVIFVTLGVFLVSI